MHTALYENQISFLRVSHAYFALKRCMCVVIFIGGYQDKHVYIFEVKVHNHIHIHFIWVDKNQLTGLIFTALI